MIKLKPQHLRESDWKDVALQLEVFFYEEAIAPILEIIKASTAQKISAHNASGDEALRRALQTGRVQYSRGLFSGKFSAPISTSLKRLGATFDKRLGVFKLEDRLAPQWVKAEASAYFQRSHLAHEAIRRELDAALVRIEQSRYDVNPERAIESIDSGWRSSAEKLAIKPPLSAQGKANLSEAYSNNLDLYIKKWLRKDILKLREDVQDNAEMGYRFDSLISKVQQRKDVGVSKAKFLARQETGLFMSQYRKQRFLDAGVTQYQWSTSHDSRVRPSPSLSPAERLHAGNHRVLDGRVFRYDQPPVVDPHTGRRANPGEDFNCRCVDIPLLQ